MGLWRIEYDNMEIGRSTEVLLASFGTEEKRCWVRPKPRPLEKAAMTAWCDDRPGSLFVVFRRGIEISRSRRARSLSEKKQQDISHEFQAQSRVFWWC